AIVPFAGSAFAPTSPGPASVRYGAGPRTPAYRSTKSRAFRMAVSTNAARPVASNEKIRAVSSFDVGRRGLLLGDRRHRRAGADLLQIACDHPVGFDEALHAHGIAVRRPEGDDL